MGTLSTRGFRIQICAYAGRLGLQRALPLGWMVPDPVRYLLPLMAEVPGSLFLQQHVSTVP